jgi:transcriptional regulator with XRE-family HTH domain
LGLPKSHKDALALPFCHVTLCGKKPKNPAYPKEIVTLGDHIRQKRLDSGLLQKDVAAIIGVGKISIQYWETNRVNPSIQHIPKIIEFLGYVPYDNEAKTFPERLQSYRRLMGLSRKQLAERAGIDGSTIAAREKGKHCPTKRSIDRIKDFFAMHLNTS